MDLSLLTQRGGRGALLSLLATRMFIIEKNKVNQVNTVELGYNELSGTIKKCLL